MAFNLRYQKNQSRERVDKDALSCVAMPRHHRKIYLLGSIYTFSFTATALAEFTESYAGFASLAKAPSPCYRKARIASVDFALSF